MRILIDVGESMPTPPGVDLHLNVGAERGHREVTVVHAKDAPDQYGLRGKYDLRQTFAALLYET